MDRETLRNYIKLGVTFVGAICLGVSLLYLPSASRSWGFLLMLILSVLVLPRMSLAIPRSEVAVSFSDTLVFLSFLLYGPAPAIILSGTETLANCYYNKWKGNIKFREYMIAANVSIGAISTTLACVSWYLTAKVLNLDQYPTSTNSLIATLGVIALMQFVCGTMIVAAFHSIGRGVAFWKTWKKDCFSSSMTQIVGAGVAGTFYEIISFGDLITMFVALATFGVVYFMTCADISAL